MKQLKIKQEFIRVSHNKNNDLLAVIDDNKQRNIGFCRNKVKCNQIERF